LESTAAQQVAIGVEACMDARDPALAIPRTDADCPPGCPWPASWHRAVAARIAQEVPGLSIAYPDKD